MRWELKADILKALPKGAPIMYCRQGKWIPAWKHKDISNVKMKITTIHQGRKRKINVHISHIINHQIRAVDQVTESLSPPIKKSEDHDLIFKTR